MITIMALCVFGGLLPIGSINAELAFPAYLLAAISGILWSAKLVFSKDAAWNPSPMHLPVAGFVAYASIRYWFSPLEYEARVELFQIVICGLVYFVCSQQFRRPIDRTILIAVVALIGLFETSYGIWQVMSKSDAVLQWVRPEGYRGRASGTLICPNHLAGMLELILGLVLARAIIVRRECQSLEKATILKVVTLYAAVMIAVGILFTFSRAGWVATVVGLISFPLLGNRLKLSWPRLAIVVVGLGLASLLAWNYGPIRGYILKSLKTDEKTQTVSLVDPTLGGRVTMWKETVAMIQGQPLVGYGGGSWAWVYQQYKSPWIPTRPDFTHNDFLNLASDYGLIGFILIAAVMVGFYRHAWSMSRPIHSPEQRAFAIGAMISVTSILVHSWFDSSLHIPGNAILFAFILGCTAALGDTQQFTARPLRPVIRYGVASAILAVCVAGMWLFIPTARATRYTDLGNLLRADLDYEMALAYYEYAIFLDPKSPEPHARRGDVFRTWANWRLGPEKKVERQQLARQAIESYDASLSLNPYQALVLQEKAKMHQILGELEATRKTYERAIAVYPTFGKTFFLLGTFYRDHGEPAKAREAFEQAARLDYDRSVGINLEELRDQTKP